jgi:hypothetical protein
MADNLNSYAVQLYVHISSIICKAHIMAKLILRALRPLLEHCSPVWSPHTLGNISKVEAVQRRFNKSIHYLSSLSYMDHMKELSIETLELRRLKQDLVVCFKTVNGDVETDPLSLFTFSICYKYKLHKQSVRVDACKLFFANRIFTA